MVKTKLQLKEILDYERKLYKLNKFKAFVKYYFLATESAVIWHWQRRLRFTEYYYNTNHKLLYIISKIKLNKLSNKYGIHIPINVCGKGLKVMHLGSVLCNGNTKIGENCSIHINTAFVAKGTSDKCPVIGNNVVIGVGSTILGEAIIADGIAVGAHSLVNKIFEEPNITIAGVPAKKISEIGSEGWNQVKDNK